MTSYKDYIFDVNQKHRNAATVEHKFKIGIIGGN